MHTETVTDGHAGSLGRADAQKAAGPAAALFGRRSSRIRRRREPAEVFRRHGQRRRRVPVDERFELGQSRVVGSDELAADDRRRRRKR